MSFNAVITNTRNANSLSFFYTSSRLRDAKASLARKLAREEARNTLEAYVYRVRDLLDQPTFVSSSVESERKAIRELNDKSGEWLWDEGESAKTNELKDKKRELE